MYRFGKGVPQDDKQAAHWYRKAAEQGELNSQYNLGVMYANGEGVPEDMTKAKYWLNKAFKGSDAEVSKSAKETWDSFELWKY